MVPPPLDIARREEEANFIKNFLRGVLAPSRGELKIYMGLASSSRRAISRGGGHHEKFSW